eukprot:1119059-Rhodomonas_salina.1
MQETELQHLKDIANRTKARKPLTPACMSSAEIQVDASRAREEVEAREEKISAPPVQALDPRPSTLDPSP